MGSVTIAKVEGGELDGVGIEEGFEGFGVEADVGEVGEGEPCEADLKFIEFGGGVEVVGVMDGAGEDVFELMKVLMAEGEAMVAPDVFADIEQFGG